MIGSILGDCSLTTYFFKSKSARWEQPWGLVIVNWHRSWMHFDPGICIVKHSDNPHVKRCGSHAFVILPFHQPSAHSD